MKHVVALVLVAAALAACSSDPKPGRWNPNGTPRDENWHSPSASLLKYDRNRDGTLTREELIAGLRSEFATHDTARRNCISPDQAQAINEMRVREDASQATPLVDWNQDSCIDFNEFSGAVLSLFATLDANNDNELSPQELRVRGGGRPPGAGSGGNAGPGQGRPGGGRRGGPGGGQGQ